VTLVAVALSVADLEAACLPLTEQVRVRRVVPPSELEEATPTDHEDPWVWLHFYGRLRAWLAIPAPQVDEQARADALVTAALREVAIPVPGVDGLSVYPKSLEGMLQLRILDAQLDRLVARLMALINDGTLTELDAGLQLTTATTYVMHLLAWAWTFDGKGLPWKATDPQPLVPEHISALGPAELLAITQAAHEFGASLAACQTLVDPLPVRDGGKRPSWAAFFEAVGAQTHIDPKELAVTHSLAKVLSMAYLASDRQRPPADA
jgi:hypothetical protein